MLGTGECNHSVLAAYSHKLNARCISAHDADIAGTYPYDNAVCCYHDDIVFLVNYLYAAYIALIIGHLVVEHTIAASVLDTVIIKLYTSAQSLVGNGENACALSNSCHGNNIVAVSELYCLYAVSSSAHGSHLGLVDSYSIAVSGGNYYLSAAVGKSYACYLVAIVKTNGSQTVLSHILVCGKGSSLYLAVLCDHDKELAVLIIGGLYHCGDLFIFRKGKHIDNINAS